MQDERDTKKEESNPEAAIVKWDFSENGTEHHFVYKQAMTPPWGIAGQDIEVTARLVVASNGDGTADVTLKDAVTIDESGEQHKLPSSSYAGMKEDGTGPAMGAPQDAMLRLLFPLPSSALKPGESSEQGIKFPVNSNEVKGYTPIRSTITLVAYEGETDNGIASFKVTIDSGEPVAYSDQEFPEGFGVRISGSGAFRFDLRNNLYLGGNIKISMVMQAKSQDESTTMTTKITLAPATTN